MFHDKNIVLNALTTFYKLVSKNITNIWFLRHTGQVFNTYFLLTCLFHKVAFYLKTKLINRKCTVIKNSQILQLVKS